MTTMNQTPSTIGTQSVDKQIIDLALKLDRYIFAQRPDGKPITVGLAVAALGVLLASKPTSPENNERMIADITSAIRAAFNERTMK